MEQPEEFLANSNPADPLATRIGQSDPVIYPSPIDHFASEVAAERSASAAGLVEAESRSARSPSPNDPWIVNSQAALQLGEEPEILEPANKTLVTKIAAYPFLAPAEQPGELGRLGGYRVLRMLGAGGMGMVFLGEDLVLHRPVALKVMLPAVAADPENRARFLREASAAARLAHDHVITVYQVGEANGAAFIAMQYLRGESLAQRIARLSQNADADWFAPEEVARIGKEVALALAAAHTVGIIHRDVKPDNIWLEAETDRIKVLDFGLARQIEDENLTKSGMLLGTPAYMAPEQAGGAPVAASDLFSLGCVLYHVTTGRRPFGGDTMMATLTALLMEEPAPILSLRPDTPPELADWIHALLRKEVAERPGDARAVAAAFAALQQRLSQSDAGPVILHADRLNQPLTHSPAGTILKINDPQRPASIMQSLAAQPASTGQPDSLGQPGDRFPARNFPVESAAPPTKITSPPALVTNAAPASHADRTSLANRSSPAAQPLSDTPDERSNQADYSATPGRAARSQAQTSLSGQPVASASRRQKVFIAAGLLSFSAVAALFWGWRMTDQQPSPTNRPQVSTTLNPSEKKTSEKNPLQLPAGEKLPTDTPRGSQPTPLQSAINIDAPPSFTRLFNGHDLNGWQVAYNPDQSVQYEVVTIDGEAAIRASGGRGTLLTLNRFGDYHLRLEFQREDVASTGGLHFHEQQGSANAVIFLPENDRLLVTCFQQDRKWDWVAWREGAFQSRELLKPPQTVTISPMRDEGWNLLELYCLKADTLCLINGEVAFTAGNCRSDKTSETLPIHNGHIGLALRGRDGFYPALLFRRIELRPIREIPPGARS